MRTLLLIVSSLFGAHVSFAQALTCSSPDNKFVLRADEHSREGRLYAEGTEFDLKCHTFKEGVCAPPVGIKCEAVDPRSGFSGVIRFIGCSGAIYSSDAESKKLLSRCYCD